MSTTYWLGLTLFIAVIAGIIVSRVRPLTISGLLSYMAGWSSMMFFIGVVLPVLILFMIPLVQWAWTPLHNKVKLAMGGFSITSILKQDEVLIADTPPDALAIATPTITYAVVYEAPVEPIAVAIPSATPFAVAEAITVAITQTVAGTAAMLPTVTILPTPDIRAWYYAQFDVARASNDRGLAKTLAIDLLLKIPGEPKAAMILAEIEADDQFLQSLVLPPDKDTNIANLLSGRTFTIVSVEEKTWQSVWSEIAVLSVVGGWIDGEQVSIYRGHLIQLGYVKGQTTIAVP